MQRRAPPSAFAAGHPPHDSASSSTSFNDLPRDLQARITAAVPAPADRAALRASCAAACAAVTASVRTLRVRCSSLDGRSYYTDGRCRQWAGVQLIELMRAGPFELGLSGWLYSAVR